MHQLQHSNGWLLETKDELPNFAEATELFADLETSSGDPTLDSLNPWHHCSIAGLAIRAADSKTYYIPNDLLDHQWVKDTFSEDKTWTNHNIKYDAHVLANCTGHAFKGRMFDTLTGAKLVDSDRWSYSLDNVCRDWLGMNGKLEHLIAPYLWTINKEGQKKWHCKDYGVPPADKMGDYACEDVNLNWQLGKFLRKYMPEESQGVFDTEQKLTSVLFESEQRGLQLVDHDALEMKQALVLKELLCRVGPALKEIVGRDFEPHISGQCLEVLHEQYGLPILDYTDKGEPSFNKHVLKQYLAIPNGSLKNSEPHQELVKLCLRWKKLWQFNNLFLETYIALGVDDIIHPTFNQCVRTGRMSCRQPNMQQLDKAAKGLIIPRAGHALLSIDYAQVEFRIIVHYIQNHYALQAYRDDPDTDFHSWAAEMVGIPRRPAKNVNFMLGYGGGKAKTLAMLQDQPDLMNEIRDTCSDENTFKIACRMRAGEVYQNYHDTLPELKLTSNRAAAVCRQRGYVKNGYGRRRKLPRKAAHKAFNTICQSYAADLMKERAVALAERLAAGSEGARLLAVVHDEFLVEVPEAALTDQFVEETVQLLQTPSVDMRVPIRCSVGTSTKTWADAG